MSQENATLRNENFELQAQFDDLLYNHQTLLTSTIQKDERIFELENQLQIHAKNQDQKRDEEIMLEESKNS